MKSNICFFYRRYIVTNFISDNFQQHIQKNPFHEVSIALTESFQNIGEIRILWSNIITILWLIKFKISQISLKFYQKNSLDMIKNIYTLCINFRKILIARNTYFFTSKVQIKNSVAWDAFSPQTNSEAKLTVKEYRHDVRPLYRNKRNGFDARSKQMICDIKNSSSSGQVVSLPAHAIAWGP